MLKFTNGGYGVFYPDDDEPIKEGPEVPGLYIEALLVPRSDTISINLKYFVGPFNSEKHRDGFMNYYQKEIGEGPMQHTFKFIPRASIPGGWAALLPDKFQKIIEQSGRSTGGM